jgi:hypothetical protein
MPIQLCMVCGCFCAAIAELSSCKRHHMVQRHKIFTVWPFKKVWIVIQGNRVFGDSTRRRDKPETCIKLKPIRFFFFLEVLGFEVRASHLPDRHSPTWVTLLAIFVLDIFKIGSCKLFAYVGQSIDYKREPLVPNYPDHLNHPNKENKCLAEGNANPLQNKAFITQSHEDSHRLSSIKCKFAFNQTSRYQQP